MFAMTKFHQINTTLELKKVKYLKILTIFMAKFLVKQKIGISSHIWR
jgi:hypothetical protein